MRVADFDGIQRNSIDKGGKIRYNEYNRYRKAISKRVAARQLKAEIHYERKMNMKKTNNNSPMKRIAASATMLAVSAAMLGTSTYAWFTMNKEVEVTGLTMKTKVSSNLLLSENNADGTYAPDRLISGRKALLEPVSSVSGKTGSFFYTLDAKESGQKAHAANGEGSIAYVPYSEAKTNLTPGEETATYNTNATAAAAGKYYFDNTFSKAYGVEPTGDEYGTAYGYVDYVFYLKATGDTDNQQLVMTACDLNYTYPGGTLSDGTTAIDANVDKAWRVAVFASDITANGGKGNTGEAGSAGATVGALDPAASVAKTILAPSDAANWTDGQAVNATTGTGAVTYGTAAVLDNDIDAGVTKYYKVLVRAWLEGEDKTCNSETYAKLTDGWSLDVEFKLQNNATGAVTVITQNGFTPDIVNTKDMVNNPVDVNRAE